MEQLRTSVALPWIIAVVGFPIGGLLAQTIAGPAATVPAALLSGLIAGAIIGRSPGSLPWASALSPLPSGLVAQRSH